MVKLLVFVITLFSAVYRISSKNSYIGCPTNEKLSDCVNNVCEYRNCSQIGQPIECVHTDRSKCRKGCICVEGYLRDDLGDCIPEELCPNYGKCTKENEVFELCPSNCPPRICGINDSNIACPEPLKPGDPNCPPPTCRCKVGFYRNTTGGCVVSSLCDLTTTTTTTTTTTSSPSTSQSSPVCPENEEYVTSLTTVCRPQSCSELGFKLPCSEQGYNFIGSPRCMCVKNYVRNRIGLCVPVKSCPSCGGDSNGESGDNSFCVTCNNYKNKPVICHTTGVSNGCKCKQGYIYNTNTRRCVFPWKCVYAGGEHVHPQYFIPPHPGVHYHPHLSSDITYTPSLPWHTLVH